MTGPATGPVTAAPGGPGSPSEPSAPSGATPTRTPADVAPLPATLEPAPSEATPSEPAPLQSALSETVTTYTARRRVLGAGTGPGVVSSGSAARFAERVAMRRRIARQRVYLGGAVVLLLAGLAWLLLLSPVLALDAGEVEVTGAGTVVDVADVQAVVAAVDGIPLPRLDTVGLRDRVLEVPGVRHAKVARIWPHGLVVSLVSREPVAAVPQRTSPSGSTGPEQAGYALLDVEGFAVGWTAAAPEGLPVIDVPVVSEGRNRSLDAVLAILEALPPELAAEVATIEATTQDTVRMGLRDGKTVVWGSAGDAELKIRVLTALRAAPVAAGAAEYDVSAPTLPITR